MQCSKEEALARLFYNVSSSITLLLLLYHVLSILVSKFFSSLSDSFPSFNRFWNEPDSPGLSNEEEEKGEDYFYQEKDQPVADVIDGANSLSFLESPQVYYEKRVHFKEQEDEVTEEGFHGDEDDVSEANFHEREDEGIEENFYREDDECTDEDNFDEEEDLGTEENFNEDEGFEESPRQQISSEQYDSQASESEYDEEYSFQDDEVQTANTDSDSVSRQDSDKCSEDGPIGSFREWINDGESKNEHRKLTHEKQERREQRVVTEKKQETKFINEEQFLVFQPPKADTTKTVREPNKDHESNKIIEETIFGDSCTNASTSKDSSEWRSSIFCRDSVSGTEDPFSSSSRRSCPNWESYTVYQKYDEEMLFLDRVSAQKLHETESLRSIQACPRSISDRLVYKLTNKRPSQNYRRSYQELEAAYVAQICLTWEALNWNYIKFRAMLASHKGESDPGCPARVAQQFQQFQVLLQRYVENEPFEHGKRPEIYARMRYSAPKLLQVPEYRDIEEEEKDDGFKSRISSPSFLMIMEEGIRTFMNFLKGDKKKHGQVIAAFFKRNQRGLVDPSLLYIIKKSNQKKKMKLQDMRSPRNCLRKRRLKPDEEMLILMGLIDLKVVSRVLRTADLNQEQLHWCEMKMDKVKIWEGKLQRDSSPLFFPAAASQHTD